MNNLLATTPRRWKFVFYHHTAYSCANGIASIGSDSTVRNTWGPICEKYDVDVVFHGHDHIYERTRFMDDFLASGASGSDGLGTIYIMTGGGGASLDQDAKIDGSGLPYRQPFFFSPKENCYWLDQDCPGGPNNYCSFDRFQYTMATISGDTLTVQAIDNSGNVFDTFTHHQGAADADPHADLHAGARDLHMSRRPRPIPSPRRRRRPPPRRILNSRCRRTRRPRSTRRRRPRRPRSPPLQRRPEPTRRPTP